MLVIETLTQAQTQALADVESCLDRQRELHREFNGFFGRLETVLSELESDLWQAFRARESGLKLELEIARLLDKHNLSRDLVGEHFTFSLSEGRQHALLVRLEMFANMIRSNEPLTPTNERLERLDRLRSQVERPRLGDYNLELTPDEVTK